MLRLARHLWVCEQLRRGVTLGELAASTGLPRATLRIWRIALDACGCGRVKRASSARCDACARRARTRWPADRLLSERDRYRAETGRAPRVIDWTARLDAERRWPPEATVRRRFDGWASFLATRQGREAPHAFAEELDESAQDLDESAQNAALQGLGVCLREAV